MNAVQLFDDFELRSKIKIAMILKMDSKVVLLSLGLNDELRRLTCLSLPPAFKSQKMAKL